MKEHLDAIRKSDRYVDRADDVDELRSIIRDAIREAEIAYDLVEEAYERGNAMEDRLYEYRKAIEELGFVRKKDGVVLPEL